MQLVGEVRRRTAGRQRGPADVFGGASGQVEVGEHGVVAAVAAGLPLGDSGRGLASLATHLCEAGDAAEPQTLPDGSSQPDQSPPRCAVRSAVAIAWWVAGPSTRHSAFALAGASIADRFRACRSVSGRLRGAQSQVLMNEGVPPGGAPCCGVGASWLGGCCGALLLGGLVGVWGLHEAVVVDAARAAERVSSCSIGNLRSVGGSLFDVVAASRAGKGGGC